MTTQRTDDRAADGGTMNATSQTIDAGRMATAAKAQRELIELLARVVLAAIEAAVTESQSSPPTRRT